MVERKLWSLCLTAIALLVLAYATTANAQISYVQGAYAVPQSPQSGICQLCPERVLATGPLAQPTAVIGALSGERHCVTSREPCAVTSMTPALP